MKKYAQTPDRLARGFSLIELVVATALMTVFGATVIQFVTVFYQFRAKDAVSERLLSESARAQAEFRYYCRNAISFQIYTDNSQANPSSQGNYCQITYQSAGQAPLVALEYVTSSKSLKITYLSAGGANKQLCAGQVSLTDANGIFGFDTHVPFLKYTLLLPASGPNATNQENVPVVAYAKPQYMR